MSSFPQPVASRDADAAPGEPLRLFQPHETWLVVVVPALNEQRTIGDVVSRIPQEMEGVHQVKVVVVDDGSTDRTGAIAAENAAVVVRHPEPCGVGAAFQSGLLKAFELGADIVVNIDGDGQFAPEDIPKLVAPILADEADFVTASRFKDPALVPNMPWVKKWGNRQVSRIISRMTGRTYYDVSCGMRAYSRSALLNLSLLERFTYTHEAFLHLTSRRMRIVEVPIVVRGEREFGKSRVARNLFKYAAQTLSTVLRYYRDCYPLRFFGWISAVCFAIGGPLVGFLLTHYLQTGSFSPHKWAAFTGGTMIVFGIIFLLMGVLGDMLNRQRVYLEDILYQTRSLLSADARSHH